MQISAILFVLFYTFHDGGSVYITTKLNDGVYSFTGVEYISMFVVTTDGVIAIEPVNSEHAKKFLEAIKNVTNQPIKYLLPSHNHWDHASGGQVFKNAGATTLVHAEAYESMVANKGPDMIVPDESWEGKTKNITLGNTTITLYFLGMNHGLGMTVFVLPETKFAYIADLVKPKEVMFTFGPDFNMKEMERTLAEIILLDFDRVVYSHDHVNESYGGSKQGVTELLQYFKDLRTGVMNLINNGEYNPIIISKKVNLTQYASWMGYDQFFEMNVLHMALEIIMGPFPWRAKRVPMCTVEVAEKSMCKMQSSNVPMCKEETKNVTSVPMCTVEVTGKSMCRMNSSSVPMCKEEMKNVTPTPTNGSPTLQLSFQLFFFLLVAMVPFF